MTSDNLTTQGMAPGHEANRASVKLKDGASKKKERRIGEDPAAHSTGLKSGTGFTTKSAHETAHVQQYRKLLRHKIQPTLSRERVYKSLCPDVLNMVRRGCSCRAMGMCLADRLHRSHTPELRHPTDIDGWTSPPAPFTISEQEQVLLASNKAHPKSALGWLSPAVLVLTCSYEMHHNSVKPGMTLA